MVGRWRKQGAAGMAQEIWLSRGNRSIHAASNAGSPCAAKRDGAGTGLSAGKPTDEAV
jgi:hypothetical protein